LFVIKVFIDEGLEKYKSSEFFLEKDGEQEAGNGERGTRDMRLGA